jgi:hypothetical protein
VSTLGEYQADIAMRMRRGDTFASVEEEVIDPSPLSEGEKSALWLYGWSFVHWRRQRREAVRHIEVLAGTAEVATDKPARYRIAGLHGVPLTQTE